jgi:DNA repair protein RecO (recombination protein O)
VPLVTSRALILQAFAYSESSKILRLLTEDHGVRSVIAKGAQRPKSRFGGVLEPFTEGYAQLYLREGRDLHTLGGFDLIRSRQQLGRDLTGFAGASLLCELALRFGTEEPAAPLFASVSAALDRIASAPSDMTAATATAAAWSAISLLGYRPELAACVACGTPVEARHPTRFDVAAAPTCTPARVRRGSPVARASPALARPVPAAAAMSVRSRFAVLLALASLAACGPTRQPPPAAAPRALPPDSAAMLPAAIARARPAYATQEEALASTIYSQGGVARRTTAQTGSTPVTPARPGPYVIQVAAYFDAEVARSAADLARNRFPDLEVIIEEAADVLRVAIGPWASERAAQSMLPAVRSHYPDAWVRMRATP